MLRNSENWYESRFYGITVKHCKNKAVLERNGFHTGSGFQELPLLYVTLHVAQSQVIFCFFLPLLYDKKFSKELK